MAHTSYTHARNAAHHKSEYQRAGKHCIKSAISDLEREREREGERERRETGCGAVYCVSVAVLWVMLVTLSGPRSKIEGSKGTRMP